ncbi:MAG: L-lactate permease [Opitutales bacterium]
METLAAFFPVVLLIVLMVKRHGMPSAKALPLVALVTYGTVLAVFRFGFVQVNAVVLRGLLLAWTPILIIAGAIFLFRTLEATGGLQVIRVWLNAVTRNRIAQLMMIGWAFPFLIEGASGFGTPAALAAPILVGLGFPPVRVATLTLIMNTVPVSFGAIGTPTWFGFGPLGLAAADTRAIGFQAAIINGLAALVVPLVALAFVVTWRSIRRNLPFIVASIGATVLPYIAVARVSTEFPALLGGAIGLLVTIGLAHRGWGLSPEATGLREPMSEEDVPVHGGERGLPRRRDLIRATFPLWGTILVLIVTRIPALGLKGWLTATEPAWDLPLGSLGTFSISAALVLEWRQMLGTSEAWSHSLLYVPSLVPFVLVSLIAYAWAGRGWQPCRRVLRETVEQMRQPTLALLGALVFVTLMMMGGTGSPVARMGDALAGLTGEQWYVGAPFLGALGSFFSGSATISNLTFGGIQQSIALSLGLDRNTVLALQSAGAAMGNMVCINNIIAVASVLGLRRQEGPILKKTVWALIPYGLVAVAAGQLLVLV